MSWLVQAVAGMTAPTFLFVLIQLLCHPLVQGVQFQASLILCVGFIGWYLSGLRRKRERLRLQSARHKATNQQQSSVPILAQHDLEASSLFKSMPCEDSSSCRACWPPLAVVLPVKGCRPHSSQNWLTQLGARYDGAVAFVFAVDAADDPAVLAITDLMAQQHQQGWTASCLSNKATNQQQQQQHDGVKSVANAFCGSLLAGQLKHNLQWGSSILAAWHQTSQSGSVEPRLVLLVQAGKATTCSQKIHNILHGIQVAQPLLEAWASAPHHQATAAAKPLAPIGTETVHIVAMAAGGTSGCSSADSSACGAAAGAVLEHASSSAAPVAGGGYVCVLDDDVWMHPLGLMQLVDDLEAHPDLFMATGYPYDIVAAAGTHRSLQDSSSSRWSRAWGHLLSYAAASYHLPLTIGFSIADRGTFVWGGAMMLRAAALQDHPPIHLWQQQQQWRQQRRPCTVVPSILEVWRQGGYSDDLLLAAYCVENGLSIGLPASALYPQLLPASITFSQYWNYLRRQLFVLDTYYSSSNKVTNHTMMLLHSYGSAVFTAAAVATFLQLLLLGAAMAGSCCCWLAAALGGVGFLAAADLSLLGGGGWVEQLVRGVRALLLQGCNSWQGSCSIQADFNQSAVSSSSGGTGLTHVTPELSTAVAPSAVLSAGLCAFVASIVLAQLSIRYMFEQCLLLIQELSPSSAQEVRQAPVSYVLLWAGWLLESALLPACVAYTYLSDWVTWGGIKYRKLGGKVVQVVHPT